MTEAASTVVSLERRFANFRAGMAARETPVAYPAEAARHTSTVGAERLAAALDGELVRTRLGSFVMVEAPTTLLPLDRARLARLPGLPPADAPLLCLDTETTGLATAAGTLAFLVGLGWWEGSLFRQIQLLLPDHADEPALLAELASRIPRGGWLVSYNGRGFDWPLLVARFRMAGSNPPLHDGHLDLLPIVRRVFKHRMPDARLASVETELLGLRRHHDVGGWEIPSRYLDYLRWGEPGPLVDVARHNDEDVRSLGRLLVHLDRDYADDARWGEAPPGDLAGLARAFAREGRHEDALGCLDTALAARPAASPPRATHEEPSTERARLAARESRSDDDVWWSPRRRPDFGGHAGRYPAPGAWDAVESSRRDAPWTETRMLAERARLLRRLGRYADAEAAWVALAANRGALGTLAWIEVAKLREHRLGDLAGAIEAATAALRLAERQAWLGRPLSRLETALGRRLARLGARVTRRRTAARSGTASRPGPSTVSDAAAAARVAGSPSDGWSTPASIAARKTSPAPVASTTRSEGIAG
ncbi:MAG TPA: ribonuclease H-like domain-containing protein [Candidatus Limnocylindrales bacterium]|nr:ribonuclease H-like domain-containing protein [Candidatus Limnocylindrales bacterium]